MLHNKTVSTLTDPRAGAQCRLCHPAMNFGGTPQSLRSLAPLPGEHTAEVLRQCGGLSDAEIAALGQKGICVQHQGSFS